MQDKSHSKSEYIGVFPEHIQAAAPFIDVLIDFAINRGASDIHIDPRSTDVVVRLRVDGIVQEVGVFPKSMLEELISRLKILSGARTDIHAIPQDGRWQMRVKNDGPWFDNLFNIRISFMPTYYGENAVMRLLPAKAIDLHGLSSLGFVGEHVREIDAALTKTSGLILVTGPTGSGKTTTLHACLSQKVREDISVISLEDPVEYEIAGVRQVHIRHTHGVTFASGLRSALRQDPDVIMVGEIRDADTAHVAVHTALTGHLVLSTLHTNSAIETIPRLIDMGVDPYLLAATLRLVIAQRLVRKLCDDCFGGVVDSGNEDYVAVENYVAEKICSSCRGTGYKGRTIIAEVCPVDSTIQNMIIARKTTAEITAYAISRGFRSLDEDGAEKVEWGVTSREEIIRVMHA